MKMNVTTWKLVGGLCLLFCTITTADNEAADNEAVDNEAAQADQVEIKPGVEVEFCGKMRHGVMTIGAECTGTTIAVERTIWEIQLLTDEQKQFSQDHHKQIVVVTGKLRKVAGIETKDRWVIDAEKLIKADKDQVKQGIKLTVLGTLQSSTAKPNDKPTDGSAAGQAATMKIDSAGMIWPIQLSDDAKLKATADSLMGKLVQLTGTLKPATAQKPDSPAMIQVNAIQVPAKEKAAPKQAAIPDTEPTTKLVPLKPVFLRRVPRNL